MSSSKKHFSLGWVLGIALVGLASNGTVVYAGQVTNPDFIPGDTLNAAHMNDIKGAVNDNDTRVTTNTGNITTNTGNITTNTGNITTNTTAITNLQTGAGTCVGNSGDDTGGVVRVGSNCVDKFRARATLGNCAGDGRTGSDCPNVVATSTATGPALTNVSYAQAARACANAGKRLLTPGEWVMVWTMVSTVGITDINTDLDGEWVSSAGSGGGGASKAQGAYIGPDLGGAIGSGLLGYRENADYDDTTNSFIYFRCGR